MSTGEKERRVINRAVRVLDEIETRIHELREELEEQGIATGRGRKGQRNAADDGGEGHEPQAKGRGRKADAGHADDRKGDHDEKQGDHEGDDDREPHGQGRVKHPESDHRLKANRGDSGHDDGHAKDNQDDKGRGDNLHGAAKSAHDEKAKAGKD